MLGRLIFDTTNADTIADSHKVLSGIISSDGSTLITDTLEGGKQGLDVYVINAGVNVNLQAGDGTDITQTGGALDVNIASGALTVTENDVYAEDSAHTSGDEGTFTLGIRVDDLTADNTALLAGSNGDYQGFFVNATGELYVKDTDVDALLTTIDGVLDNILTDTNALVVDAAAIEAELLDQGTTLDTIESELQSFSHEEDEAHTSGDVGIMGLAVRNDTLGTLADTDGDYAPLQVDADGALYTTIGGEIDVDDTANTDLANTATTVAATATDLVGTDLAARKYLFVYNNSNRRMFIGDSSVTAANGFPLDTSTFMMLRAGAAIDLHAIHSSVAGLQGNARILELS